MLQFQKDDALNGVPFGVLLVILAIDLVVQGVKALSAQKKAAAAK